MNLDGIPWSYTVYTRTTKPVQTTDMKGKFPPFILFIGTLGHHLHSPLVGFTHAASTQWLCKYNSQENHRIFHFQIYTSLVDGIPFKTSSFKMIQTICNVCVNIRSVLRTHSKATTAWAASEKWSYIHVSPESSNYLNKQSYDFTWNHFHWTAKLGTDCKLTTSRCFMMQRILQGGRLIYCRGLREKIHSRSVWPL